MDNFLEIYIATLTSVRRHLQFKCYRIFFNFLKISPASSRQCYKFKVFVMAALSLYEPIYESVRFFLPKKQPHNLAAYDSSYLFGSWFCESAVCYGLSNSSVHIIHVSAVICQASKKLSFSGFEKLSTNQLDKSSSLEKTSLTSVHISISYWVSCCLPLMIASPGQGLCVIFYTLDMSIG